MTSPTGAYTQWRASNYTGFYDNSISGIAGDLNQTIGQANQDVYYFTLSFAATVPVPKLILESQDVSGLSGEKFEELMGWVGEWKKKLGDPVITKLQKTHLFSRLSLSSTSISTTSTPTMTTTTSSHTTVEERDAGIAATAKPESTQPVALTFLQSLFGHTLQDLVSWATSRINSRLPNSVPRLPSPGTTIARIDMFPGFLVTCPGMCAFKISAKEREIIKGAGGTTHDEDWHEHDGVVPTCSMAGPWGSGNRVVTVEEIVRGGVGVKDGGRGLQGIWVNLGKSDFMDHADCIGSSLNPATLSMVIDLYVRISRLLEVLPVDKSIGELDVD